jgi:hypothetical protein
VKKSTLQKLGGIALISGVLFLTAWSVCWTTFLPVHERTRDASLLILNTNWIWISSLAFPGIVFMILGFTAVYAKIYKKAGVVGFFGYLFIIVAYIFQAAKVTWEIFVYPAIVNHVPSLSLFRDGLFFLHPQVRLFRTMAEISIFLGVLLFCWTLLRSTVFPRTAGILILCGAFMYALGPMITIYLAIAGVVTLAAGCFILGITMLSDNKA